MGQKLLVTGSWLIVAWLFAPLVWAQQETPQQEQEEMAKKS